MNLAIYCVLPLLGTALACGTTSVFTLTIMHTNDCHARIEQTNVDGGGCSSSAAKENRCFGGVARRMTKIQEIRKKYEHTILLDAGDQFQGTVWFTVFEGVATAHYMKKMGYDAMALGNHEFDNGIPSLVDNFLKNVTLAFPVLSCNMDASTEPKIRKYITKSKVLNVAGHKVGVIGYTTKDMAKLSHRIGNLKFSDEIPAIQAEVDRMQKEGIYMIIALGHSGYEADLEIAKKVKGLDLVVGGHTNTFLYNGTAPSKETIMGSYPTVIAQDDGAKVLVVQDYAFGKYLGFLQVTFSDKGVIANWTGNPILLDGSVPQDPGLEADVAKRAENLASFRTEIIGQSEVVLDGSRQNCRRGECNLGSFLCDAMIWYADTFPDGVQWSNVAISLWNAGGIRAGIEKGDVTLEDLIRVAPFQNSIDVVELYGRHIREALEHAVHRLNGDATPGEFLQIAGMEVVYDVSKPSGQRVVSVEVNCNDCDVPSFQPLDDSKVYQVIMPAYLLNGGDGFSVFKNNRITVHVTGGLDTDVILAYFKTKSPVKVGVDGRIQVFGLEDTDE